MAKKQMFNAAFICLGILGFAVLFFRWYTVVSRGMGIEYTGESIIGFSAVNTSIFGYLLYVLPVVLIAMVFAKTNFTDKQKCLAGAGIGVVEIICWFIVHSKVQSTNIDWGIVVAKWEPGFGRTFALIIYIATIVASLLLYFVVYKDETTENQN